MGEHKQMEYANNVNLKKFQTPDDKANCLKP